MYCNCFPVYDVINFNINLRFLVNPLPYITKKVRTEIEISQQQNNVFYMN